MNALKKEVAPQEHHLLSSMRQAKIPALDGEAAPVELFYRYHSELARENRGPRTGAMGGAESHLDNGDLPTISQQHQQDVPHPHLSQDQQSARPLPYDAACAALDRPIEWFEVYLVTFPSNSTFLQALLQDGHLPLEDLRRIDALVADKKLQPDLPSYIPCLLGIGPCYQCTSFLFTLRQSIAEGLFNPDLPAARWRPHTNNGRSGGQTGITAEHLRFARFCSKGAPWRQETSISNSGSQQLGPIWRQLEPQSQRTASSNSQHSIRPTSCLPVAAELIQQHRDAGSQFLRQQETALASLNAAQLQYLRRLQGSGGDNTNSSTASSSGPPPPLTILSSTSTTQTTLLQQQLGLLQQQRLAAATLLTQLELQQQHPPQGTPAVLIRDTLQHLHLHTQQLEQQDLLLQQLQNCAMEVQATVELMQADPQPLTQQPALGRLLQQQGLLMGEWRAATATPYSRDQHTSTQPSTAPRVQEEAEQLTFSLRKQLCCKLAEQFNDWLQTGMVPQTDSFLLSTITSIEKRQSAEHPLNLADPADRRGIAVSSLTPKLMELVLLSRISHLTMEWQLLGPSQVGFLPMHSAEMHIMRLIGAVKANQERQQDSYILFLDLKKAYDSVHQPTMWALLHSMGIPRKLINLLSNWNKDRRAAVRVNGTTSQCSHWLPGLPCDEGPAPRLSPQPPPLQLLHRDTQ